MTLNSTVKVGQLERETQNRIVRLFTDKDKLGYEYLGNWQDRADNSHIEESYLRWHLNKQGYSENVIGKAVFKINFPRGRAARY